MVRRCHTNSNKDKYKEKHSYKNNKYFLLKLLKPKTKILRQTEKRILLPSRRAKIPAENF